MTIGRGAGTKVCDDCRREYTGPAYYTFSRDTCTVQEPPRLHLDCTGNVCSSCAGPDLEPDRPDDPRRPS